MNDISKFWEIFLNYEKFVMNDYYKDNFWLIFFILD